MKLFTPWNWIIGTGFYIQDVDNAMMNEMILFIAMIMVTCIVIGFSTYFVSKSISKPINSLAKSNELLSKGILTEKATNYSKHDEIGILTHAYNNTLIFLKNVIAELNQNSELLYESSN